MSRARASRVDGRPGPPRGAIRATVDGAPPLRVELDVAGAAEELGATRRSDVRRLPPTGDDRAAGRRRAEVVVEGWRFEVELEDAARAALRERATRLGRAPGGAARSILRAQIPGRVLSVAVAVGEAVLAGQRLLSVEAMKMENEVRASRDGIVERVTVVAGQTVERGDELVVIA